MLFEYLINTLISTMTSIEIELYEKRKVDELKKKGMETKMAT